MNILHVYKTFFPDSQGGLEEAIRQICSGTQELGAKTRVLSCTRDPDPSPKNINGIEVYRAKQFAEIASCNLSVAAFSTYRKHAEWADVIHFHFPWPLADLLALSHKTDKPKVLTYHSDIVKQRLIATLYHPLMKAYFNRVQAIVATSENYVTSSHVLQRLGDKLRVIPLGIDEQGYPKADKATNACLSSTLPNSYFLFIGVLRYYKGLEYLLRAAQGAPFQVVIAGSGPQEANIRRMVNDLDLKNVSLTGQVTDAQKVALMENARAVVLPSHLRSEAFGVTLLEGAMFAKPLVTTELGTGTSWVCANNENGLVVPPANPPALRHALETLWSDSGLCNRFSAASRERYERLFTTAAMARQYMVLYQQLGAEPSG